MAQELKAIGFPSFGGLRLDKALDEVGAANAIFLRDVDWDGSLGKLRSRDGFQKLKAAEASGTYKALFPHSSLRLLATKRVSAESVKLVAIDREGTEQKETTWTKEVCKANFAHYGVPTASYTYARGAHTAHKVIRFDGTNFIEPTCKIFENLVETGSGKPMPKANFMQAWPDARNRMVFANMGATGGPNELASNSSRVWFSKAGSAEEFETTAWVDLGVGDGEEIVGMCLYGGYVFVFKETKFFVFYSVSLSEENQPEFNYREVSMGEGSRMKRATAEALVETSDQICAAGAGGVYFATTDGIYVTAGGAPAKISQALSPLEETSAFVGPMATFLNGASEVCRWPAAGMAVLGSRVVAKRNEYLFVYDLPSQEWLCWKAPNVSLAVWTGLTSTSDTLSVEKLPGSAADIESGVAWKNIANIKAEGTEFAECTLAIGTPQSKTVELKTFGVTLPSTAIPVGLILLVNKAEDKQTEGEIWDNGVNLVNPGGFGFENKGTSTPWPATFQTVAYGGIEDLWGFPSLTKAEVESSSFKALIGAQLNGFGPGGTARAKANWAKLVVYYRIPEAASGARPRLFCTQGKTIYFMQPGAQDQLGTSQPEYESGFYDLANQDEKTLEHFKMWGTGKVKLQVAKDFGEPGAASEVELGTAPVIAQGSGNKSQTASLFSHRFSGTGPWSIQRFIRYLRETRTAATKSR